MKIWVLVDNRVGSSNQSIALAEILGYSYEIKEVSFTSFIKLPNFFPFLDSLILDKKTKKSLYTGKPDIIIGAGRRLARVLSSLKSKHPQCKFVQILKPDMPIKSFDAVILPNHDTIKLSLLDNRKKIIRVNGAVVKHRSSDIDKYTKLWSPTFAHLQKPRIALLIGGGSKHSKIEKKHAIELVQSTVALAKKLKASILVTNSRRTDKSLSALIFKEIRDSGINHFLYDTETGLENPYKGYLACADYIVVTGDSISMCIESVNMGKPVIVYAPKAIMSKKHWHFIEQLVSDGQVNLLRNFDVNSIVLPTNTDDDLKSKLLSVLGIKET